MLFILILIQILVWRLTKPRIIANLFTFKRQRFQLLLWYKVIEFIENIKEIQVVNIDLASVYEQLYEHFRQFSQQDGMQNI